MNISIAICTHNRAQSLYATISAVLKQQYTRGKLEVLVVDNCSSDNTRQITESLQTDSPIPLHYFYEEKSGLSNARNLALKKAQGDVIIFIDDDAIPVSDHWAANIAAVYEDPHVAVAGGDLSPEWPEGIRPTWLPSFLLPPLGITRFKFNEVSSLRYPHYPWGANISYRKKNLQEIGGFSNQLGWSSNGTMISGEETEMNLRLESAGKKVVYVPQAVVKHVISPEKLNEKWFFKRALGQGLSDAAIDQKYASKPKIAFTFMRKFANVLFYLVAIIFFSPFAKRKPIMFCRYNIRFAGGYMLRVLNLL